MQARQLRLHHASSEDAELLRGILERTGRDVGSPYERAVDGMLELRIEDRG